MNTHGPCFMALYSRFLAVITVPHGGGMNDAVKFFMDTETRKKNVELAMTQTLAAIDAIRHAPGAMSDDEEVIACYIMEELHKLEASRGYHGKL